MPNWEKIREDWETSNISFPALAKKHGVNVNTVKSKKIRDGWERDMQAIEDAEPTKSKPATATATKQPGATATATATEKEQPEDAEPELPEAEKLNERQKDFCHYYIKSYNATQSAIKAGYSARTAHSMGPRLLNNVEIKDYIRALKAEMNRELMIDAKDLIMLYVKIAMADITDFVKFGQKEMKVIDEYTGEVELYTNGEEKTYTRNQVDFMDSGIVDGTIVTEVKQGRDGVSVKLADKQKAMDFLAKHFDLIPDPFKRQLELERLKLERARVYGFEDAAEVEDDGFNAALDAKAAEVWGDDSDDS